MAWAEWEIIQHKIDNVSTFPFTIKTWAVAVSGALLGLGSGFNLPPAMLFSTTLIPVLFWVIESKHHRMRNILGRRASQLEVLIGRLAPIATSPSPRLPKDLIRSVRRVPGVALAIQRADDERDRAKFSFWRPPGITRTKWAVRNVRVLWHKYIVVHADGIFYIFQFALVAAIAASLIWFRVPSETAKPTIVPLSSVMPSLAQPVASPNAVRDQSTTTPQPPEPANDYVPVDENGLLLPTPFTSPTATRSPSADESKE